MKEYQELLKSVVNPLQEDHLEHLDEVILVGGVSGASNKKIIGPTRIMAIIT